MYLKVFSGIVRQMGMVTAGVVQNNLNTTRTPENFRNIEIMTPHAMATLGQDSALVAMLERHFCRITEISPDLEAALHQKGLAINHHENTDLDPLGFYSLSGMSLEDKKECRELLAEWIECYIPN
ncbi:hypothetical protein HZB07_05820 [Candidatus Saganbacteria bacterium]|nr:hypothetical protein [Candidatus Saganbacteria bacterium]